MSGSFTEARLMNSSELARHIKHEARRIGFELVGIAPARTPSGWHRLLEWIERGYAGEMRYLADRAKAYEHPDSILSGVRSLVMLGLNYHSVPGRYERDRPGLGRISRYAWSDVDYHDVIHERLRRMADVVHNQIPTARCRGVVDTAPLLEREFAQLAGLGWVGKHTLLINRESGSWFFLAALLTDVELAVDEPFTADHCGTCRACLDACPTQAFPAPYVLDATRCISYLTIELRSAMPHHLRPHVGEWLFGCDVCQDVCPWNRRAPASDEPAWQPRLGQNPVDLLPLFELDDEAFRVQFRPTPLWRPRRRGILRNAAIVLGNARSAAAVPALARALGDTEPLVRGAAAWALGQIGTPEAQRLLAQRQAVEEDGEVRQEIACALEYLQNETPGEGGPIRPDPAATD